MDDEVAAMMADLGITRREVVVAPESRNSIGPFANENDKRLDAEEELHIRRQQLKLDALPENEKHAKYQQWHSAKNFGVDEVAELGEDRYGGQGHRARMREKIQAGDYDQSLDGSNAGHRGGGNRGGRGGGRGGFNGNHGAMPQQLHRPAAPSPIVRQAPSIRGARSLAPGRTRVPSPRAGGITRFVNGRAVSVGPSRPARQIPRLGREAQQAKENTNKGPAAMLARSQATALHRATGGYSKASTNIQGIPDTSLVQAAPAGSPARSRTSSVAVAPSVATATPSITAHAKAMLMALAPSANRLPVVPVQPLVTTTPSAISREGAASHSLPQPATLPVLGPSTESVRTQVRKSAVVADTPAKVRAIAVAETPNYRGGNRDAQLVQSARAEISEDVVHYAAKPESEEASRYFATHKHRAWLLQPAIDALHDRSPEGLADLTVQAIVERAAIVRQKAGSLPSPPLSAERGRRTSRNDMSALGAPLHFGNKVGGIISVDYYDVDGNALKHERIQVAQPVNLSVTVNSKSGEYDPIGMADQMRVLAKRMVQHF